jgi:hypothetical protein
MIYDVAFNCGVDVDARTVLLDTLLS